LDKPITDRLEAFKKNSFFNPAQREEN